MTAHTKRH